MEPDRPPFFVSPNVRFAEVDDVVILLDLKTSEYFAFDDVGSGLWCRLVDPDASYPALLDELRDERGDVAGRFIEACLRRGFLTAAPVFRPSTTTSRSPSINFPLLTPRAWLHLVLTWAALRAGGFGELYANLIAQPASLHPRHHALLSKAVDSFVRAENLFWFRAAPDDCLPRSLALFRYLRALGLPATHRIGVRRFPGLLMHAWVESGGRPLLDDPEFVGTLTVLSSIP